MVTLKQLVDNQKFSGMSDIAIVKTFFELNDMEEDGMTLIHELAESKIKKLKQERKIVREWTSYLPTRYLYETYPLDIAEMLHVLELDYLSHGCELSKNRLEWAKENIPNIKMPNVYFRPLIEYLDDKGIRFKGQEPVKESNKMFN